MHEILSFDIDAIQVRPGWNIRGDIKSQDITSLKESIEKIGLQQPIIVNSNKELLAGYRRYTVCKALGHKFIHCKVLDFEENASDMERLSHLDENLESMTLGTKQLEKALAEKKAIYARLYPSTVVRGPKKRSDKNKLTKVFEKVAANQTGKDPETIRRMTKRVDNATPEVREAYERDEIKASQVDEIVKLPKEDQKKVLEKTKGSSVAETRLAVEDRLNRDLMPKPSTQERFVRKVINHTKALNLIYEDLIKGQQFKDISDPLYKEFETTFQEILDNTDELLKLINGED